MSVPILTFFNNKGGVGKTTLAYHLSWMFSELGVRVLAVDVDPQANLTSAFLDEDILERIWLDGDAANTLFRCIAPLLGVGDIRAAEIQQITPQLGLVAGDLALSGFEDQLSSQWPDSMGDSNLYRPFRVLTAFWQVAQAAAESFEADLILFDVGPNLGAINRSALIASDHVIIPLGADLFSLQGLRNLGPALRSWRALWRKRLDNWPDPAFALPRGQMEVIGYISQQHSVRLSRPVKAYDKWLAKIPREYRNSVVNRPAQKVPDMKSDPNCLAMLKHYRSLVPLAQEARKPMFRLTVADGAIGAHANAATLAYGDFRDLARTILRRLGLDHS